MTDKPQSPEHPPPEIYPPLAALLSALGPSASQSTEDGPAAASAAPTKENRNRSAFARPVQQGVGPGTEPTSYERLPPHLRTALDKIHTPTSTSFPALDNRLGALAPKEEELDEEDIDTDSNQAAEATNQLPQPAVPLTADAKRRRRQEINRESARRVRKRKTEAHRQLQLEVAQLKKSLSTAQGDQAVTVRYALELYKEHEQTTRKASEFENKWIAAEVQSVSLRQEIDKLRARLVEQS